jgi:alpha-methylacyl-CoA racemase
MPGVLAGLRVVEIASLGPGPFAGMLLADMGADVIRVTRPGPRELLEEAQDVLTRGRTCVDSDLKQPEGKNLVRTLSERADVLIEGFRPGVMERLGLGPDVLLRRNPRLVYGRVTGYGQEGPLAAVAGHDINYIAIAGVLGAIRRPEEAPTVPLNLIADFGGGGMLLALGVVCAVLAASRSGIGQVVDVSMVDGAALLTTLIHGLRAHGAWSDVPGSNLLDGGAHFYCVYETADGGYMAVGAIEPKFYAELLRLLRIPPDELPQWDHERWPAFKARIADVFRRRSRQEWIDVFEWAEACVTPVLDLFEASAYHHNAARRETTTGLDAALPTPAPRFSGTPVFLTQAVTIDADEAMGRWLTARDLDERAGAGVT